MQVLGFLVAVVPATHTPDAIEAAIAAFLEGYVYALEAMPPAKYREHVAAAVANKLLDDHNMLEEAERFFSEIATFQCAARERQ